MNIKFVFCFLMAMILANLAYAADPVVREEKQLNYADIRDGQTTWVQLATQFFSAADAGTIPGYMDIYNVAKDTDGIRNVVVVRSSFYLPVSINEIRTRMGAPVELSKYSKKLKVKQCSQAECSGEIRTSLASMEVRLRYGLLDQSNASGAWKNLFSVIHNPDLIAAQEFTYIESVFAKGGGYTAFYKMSEGLTWAQSYQVFSVKQSAYDKARMIPFLNLDKLIRNTFRDMILDARSSVMQEQVYALTAGLVTRMPAASQYDKDLYSQKAYQLVDPNGDLALVRRAEHVPMNAMKALFQGDAFSSKEDPWMPEGWETVDPLAGKVAEPVKGPGPSIQGRDKPIKVDEFSEMLNQVLREEKARGMNFTVGSFHQWSPEIQANVQSPVLGLSKIFVCLAMGFSSRFMVTDQEKNLWQWIMTKDYNSITFPEMFRASIRLNRGDIYLSLLTVENLLSANWRYGERESLPATKRLRPITSGYNYEEDKFGTWYHFFGMILYGYTTGKGKGSNLVGRGEAIGSNVLSPGVDKTQKQWFNKLGGYIGSALRESVESSTFMRSPSNPAALKEDYYLNRSEDFRDRLPIQNSPELSLKMTKDFAENSTALRISNQSGKNLVNCKVEVMTDKGAGYYAALKYEYTNLSINAQKSTELSLPEALPRGVRVFVSSCQEGSSQAVEVRAKGAR